MIADVLIKLVDSRTDIAGEILYNKRGIEFSNTRVDEDMIRALVSKRMIFNGTPIVNLMRIDARTTRAIVGEGVAWNGVLVVYVTEIA